MSRSAASQEPCSACPMPRTRCISKQVEHKIFLKRYLSFLLSGFCRKPKDSPRKERAMLSRERERERALWCQCGPLNPPPGSYCTAGLVLAFLFRVEHPCWLSIFTSRRLQVPGSPHQLVRCFAGHTCKGSPRFTAEKPPNR